MNKYTEGICGNGAAILKDGEQMSLSEVLADLNDYARIQQNKEDRRKDPRKGLGYCQKYALEWLKHHGYWDSVQDKPIMRIGVSPSATVKCMESLVARGLVLRDNGAFHHIPKN